MFAILLHRYHPLLRLPELVFDGDLTLPIAGELALLPFGEAERVEPRLELDDGARVRASSQSERVGEGGAGSIRVFADRVELAGGSEISVFARQGAVPDPLPPEGEVSDGLAEGNIALEVRDLLVLGGGSRIEASIEAGLGGSITIGAELVSVETEGPGQAFDAVRSTQGVVLQGSPGENATAILAQARASAVSPAAEGTPVAGDAAVAASSGARGGDIEIDVRA